MRILVLLFFLGIAGVSGSSLPLDDSPQHVMLVDGDCAFTRTYQCKNERDEKCLTTLSYLWEYKAPRPNIGTLEVKNVNEGRELTIAMEYGQNQRELLQTEICFKDNIASSQQRAIMTSVAAPGRSGANEGYITVMAPRGPILWGTTEGLIDSHVRKQAAISADENGVVITRYLFCTNHTEKVIFVRIGFRHKSLNEITISLGKGAYGAVFYSGKKFGARERVWDTETIKFSP